MLLIMTTLKVNEVVNVEKISVSLSVDLANMVREAVNDGGYTSSSEVIREALRDWKLKQAAQAAELGRLRDAVRTSTADLQEGRYTSIQTERELGEFVDDIKKRGRERLAASNSE